MNTTIKTFFTIVSICVLAIISFVSHDIYKLSVNNSSLKEIPQTHYVMLQKAAKTQKDSNLTLYYELNALLKKRIDNYVEESEVLFDHISLLFFLSFLLFIIIVIMIRKKILLPVESLTKSILNFKNGKVEENKTTYYQDEIGLMTKQFFDMKESLNDDYKVIKKLKEHTELALMESKTAVLDWDFIDNSFYISSVWKNMLGFTENELPNNIMSWKRRVHKDDKKEVFSSLKKSILERKEIYENIHRLKKKNQEWIWVLGRAKIIYNSEGKAIRMIGTHTDITQEKELQLKYAQQAQIIDQVHDSVISMDFSGVIQSWNMGSQVLLGYTAQEAIGKNIKLIYADNDFDELCNNIDMLKSKGKHQSIIKLHKKSNEKVDVELTLSLLKNEKDNVIGIIAYAKDITTRIEAELALKEQHKYLQSVLNGVNDPIMVIKEDYSVELMNNKIKENMKSSNIADLCSPKCYEVSYGRTLPCDGSSHPCPLKKVMETKKHYSVVHKLLDKKGNTEYLELSATPLLDSKDNCIGIIESARDITEHVEVQNNLRKEKHKLSYKAYHDSLTGLPNRMLFNDRLKDGIEKSRFNNSRLALFFIDLDHFKEINDTLGHAIGDEVLKTVAKRFKTVLEPQDTLARLGGDEFTIVIEDIPKSRDISLLAKKIVGTLSKPMQIEGEEIIISCSIGISYYPENSNNADEMIKYADEAMYEAKSSGRNNFKFHSID